MSLDVNKLTQEFENMFVAEINDEPNPNFIGYPSSIAAAAANFANAYNTYAVDATDVSGDPILTVNQAGFQSTIAGSPQPGSGSPEQMATIFDTAFITYWQVGTFDTISLIPGTGASGCINVGGTGIFSSELSSVVASISPNVLRGLLLPLFSQTTGDGAQAAADLANAFHTATTTAIIVLISGLDTTPPLAGPLPITNTCTVF